VEVINKYKASPEERTRAVYIGRPSPLQNPFPITDSCNREQSIERFRAYFIARIIERDQRILSAIESLKEDDLIMCYCKPAACHGDTVKEIWEFFHREGGVSQSLELFDWVYGNVQKKGTMMSTNVQCLLALEHPEHKSLNDDAKAVELYRNYLARQIMARDPAVENAFRGIIENQTELNITPMTPYEASKLVIIAEFVSEFRKNNLEYELAYHHFKNDHNHQKIDFDPAEDGITHINVYSKGKTELGRLLSNFGHTPFKHPEYGYFSSVEAFWYWLSLGKQHDNLRSLYGFQAKKEGSVLRDALEKQGNKKPEMKGFNAEIKKAILCKIEQNERLCSLLKNSSIPLTHYYIWGDEKEYRITYPEAFSWIHEYIEDVRDFLNGKAHKLLIAGSRTINDDDLVRACYRDLKIKVIEFVSGVAKRGPDASCITIAAEENLPCMKFPADWDKNGKAAGFIRNEEMAQYATFGLILWDGESHGSKHMIERCKFYGIQHVVIRSNKTAA